MGLLRLNRLGLLGNPLRTMPSAVLNGPTPKLLAHLRGKIVDAAPQWEGDVRGSMHAPPRAECSLLSIGAEHEDGRRLASVGAENVQPARANMGPAEGGHDHTSFGYGSQEHGGYIGGVGGVGGYGGCGGYGGYGGDCSTPGGGFARAAMGAGGGRGGFDALYNRPPPSARSNGAAGGSAPRGGGGFGGGSDGSVSGVSRGCPMAGACQSSAPAEGQRKASQVAASQASANQAGQALAVHLMKEGTELAMSGLNLSALPPAGYPESLTRVDASANRLTELPHALTDLPSLMALDVSRNLLSDLPPELGSCARLTSVRASHNKLVALPFVRGVLPYLAELHLDRNGLTELPAALWGCPSLKSVSLCANRLTLGATRMPADMGAFYAAADTYPGAEMSAVAPLEMLDLGENRLGAMPPVHLYVRLRELHVQQNGIRELPADELRPLRLLQTLDVSMNDVSALPPELALLPVLQNLNIVGNPIRSIPQSVQQRGATAVIDLLRKRLPDSALR